jgi:GNAT superfamily N-acetyltransferase
VIEKIGGGSGQRGVGASSRASYYYDDYVSDKVYSEISNLCVQSYFGSSKKEIKQRVQSSTQKEQLYKSLQPEELRRRRDDIKTASEFFVAYELREATAEDMEEYRRGQELQRQRMQQDQERRRVGNPASRQYNGRSNSDHYYRVDHRIKSPAKMTSDYEPYGNRRQDDFDGESPVVMGGTLGGVAGRRQARQQTKTAAQRPLKRYRPQTQQQPSPRRSRWQQVEANESRVHQNHPAVAGGGRDLFNSRRSYPNTIGDYEEHGFPDPFYNPYTMEEVDEPMVIGGQLGSVGPAPRRQTRMNRGVVGPLFAHRHFQQYGHDFDYFQHPPSAHRDSGSGERWTIEQPFMVQNQVAQSTGGPNPHRERQTKRRRHSQPPMPHEATTAHTYSSSDEINFEYHYNPNVQPSNVKADGLPIVDGVSQQQRPQQQLQTAAQRQRQQHHYDSKARNKDAFGSHYSHAEAIGEVLEKEAPMYVKGPMVGFVEIVHAPYSLGVLDDPEMLTAGMKPHRPVLRNLVVAKHAQNSGIGTRLLQACERHVQTHWQMKELVVEVDDLWGEVGKSAGFPLHKTRCNEKSYENVTRSAVEFYLSQGYQIAFSDPESNRYDDKTGEIICQIQCRRDVLRKVFDKKDLIDSGFSNVHSSQHAHSKAKAPVDVNASAVDVEYITTATDSKKECSSGTKSAFKEDIHDCGSTAMEVELITDPSEGPRSSKDKSTSTISCDPDGPNQSIFNYSSESIE